jgi:malate dehydrogenase (oxaloacetate-decarboxylating)
MAVVMRWDAESGSILTTERGRHVLNDARLNKGVAFTDEERRALGLTGLLPPQVLTLAEQAARAYELFGTQHDDLAKHVFLTALRDRNEVLFYRLLADHIAEMLPIVYTPTVGDAIMRYSHEYRRPHGVYLSVDAPDDVEPSLLATGLGPEDVDLIVATDSEAILGIGDWGIGGIEIAVGKLAVYTAAAGIHPDRTIPIVLDVGTERESLLEDPLYLGNRHRRVDEETYDAFVDHYVDVAHRLFPDALLHWEDFGALHARRVLARHRHRVLSFNDDIQGTAAVAHAAILSATRLAGTRLTDQRVVVFGAGTAGIGIAEQVCAAMVEDGLDAGEATRRFWCLGRRGLLVRGGEGVRPFQEPYCREPGEVAGWARDPNLGGITLQEVVRRVGPTVLVGTSGIAGAFDESVVRAMAAATERPIVLPLSNPTVLSEAAPADLVAWTDGRVLVATGSPFPPVLHDGIPHVVAQANNALVFPGLVLGVKVARASIVTDGMLRAAARALAAVADPTAAGAPLLPLVDDLRSVSTVVACATARAAVAEGLARAVVGDSLEDDVRAAMWEPRYHPVRAL